MPMNAAKLLLLNVLGGDAAFSPLDISGLALWLDASDSATLYQDSAATTPAAADADPVGYMRDKSGRLRNTTQSTAGKRPQLKLAQKNNRNILRFDASDDFMQASFGTTVPQPNAIWIALKLGAGIYMWDGATGSNRQYSLYAGSLYMSAGNALITAFGTPTDWHIYSCIFNGASSVHRVDGVEIAAGYAGTNATDGLTLNAVFDGTLVGGIDFGEAVMVSGLPSVETTANLDSYFNGRWG